MSGGVVAVMSLLHQAPGASSAQRSFRDRSILGWTLERVTQAQRIGGVALICWEDQVEALRQFSDGGRMTLVCKGPRAASAKLEAISASMRWSDGWRGGLLGACHFDVGFDAEAVNKALIATSADSALVVDPDAALVDAIMLDALIEHAEARPGIEYCFSPAAPGLCGALIRAPLLNRLAAAHAHLGRMLNYYPDQPGMDPIAKGQCAPAPTSVARTLHRFNLDSVRQIGRMERATAGLNGELKRIEGEELVRLLDRLEEIDALPREVELEINTNRATRPIYWPGGHLDIQRPPMSVEIARRLFREIADVRLTFGGVGDPLRHPQLIEIVRCAKESGVRGIHVETDLLSEDPAVLRELVACGVDVVSVHLPATSVLTYAKVMGVDALARVIDALAALIRLKQEMGRGTPLIVPTFVKCRENLHEMEAWYDHWLMAVGSAVIRGPSDYCGKIPDCAVADMSPPRRRACRRLSSRLSVLSDGTVVPCSQDVLGMQPAGRLGERSLSDIWRKGMEGLRSTHRGGQWTALRLCAGCREWDRP